MNWLGLDFRAGALALVITSLVLYLLQPFAARLNLLDHPKGRKDHAHPTPVTGGLAIMAGCLAAFVLTQNSSDSLQAFLIAGGLLVAMGVYDDLHDLRWYIRILIQAVATLLIIYWGGVRVAQLGPAFGLDSLDLGWLSVPFTLVATIGIINAMNMIDGADGLAGSLGLATLVMLMVAAIYAGNTVLAARLSVLCGALAGFLAWNVRLPWRPRAKVFLGNAGSALLGIVIAWVSFRLTQNPDHPVNPVLALWLLPIPIMDCLVVSVRRLRQGRSPFAAGRDHIHHYMLDAGIGPTRSAMILAAFSLACGLGVALLIRTHWLPYPVLLAGFVAMCLGWYALTANRERAVGLFQRLRRQTRPSAAPKAVGVDNE